MKNFVIFTISGDRTVLEPLIRELKIQADRTYMRDGMYNWQLNSKAMGSDPVGVHIQELLRRLASSRIILKRYQDRLAYDFTCTMDPGDETERISPDLLLIIGSLGAGLEIQSFPT